MLPSLYERFDGYRDEDLTFFTHVYRDADLLEWMLSHLRRHFPESRIIVCSDGDEDPRLARIAVGAGAEFHLGERLYALTCGGRISQRMLELFFQRPTRYLLKVDTDTGFHRRFEYMPARSGLFGTLQCNPLLCSVQGGFCGFEISAAEKLLESQVLLDPDLAIPEKTWARHGALLRYVRTRDMALEDWITGYVATALGIPQFGFPEVRSNWNDYVPNSTLRYAVTHPCKQMRL